MVFISQPFCTYLLVKSDVLSLTHEVPKGLVLGAILFINYINDIHTYKNTNTILFLDSTTSFSYNKCHKELLIDLKAKEE